MEKNLTGTLNRLYNGDFLKKSEAEPDFPEAWLQIGGNHETKWNYRHQTTEKPVLEISNTTAIIAGIIQSQDASLNVGKDKEWLIKVIIKGALPDTQAYLRIYPIKSNGDVSKPWEFCYRLGWSESKEFKQVINAGSNMNFLRLETGILGLGNLYIYKIIAHPFSSNRIKRTVKKSKKVIPAIKHIQTIGEIIKPIQLAMPIPLKIPVTVQANVNADIRDLTPIRDKVQIYGSSQAPLATSICGRAQVEIYGHGFYESLEVVTANQALSSTTTRDVSALPRVSFAINNFGNDTAYVQAELSPDGVHWAAVGDQQEVSPGKLVIVSPEKFLRYTRLSYWAGGMTTLRIWVQAQS